MSNLRLVISGPPGSGRSTLAGVINEFCSMYGFNTEIIDYPGELAPGTTRSTVQRIEMTTRLRQIAEKGGKLTIVANQTPHTSVRVADQPLPSVDFEVGNRYLTQSGKLVKLVERTDGKGYEAILGNDGIWRYNRDADRGRVTGSAHNFTHPDNLVPLYAHSVPGEIEELRMELALANRTIANLKEHYGVDV